MTITALEQKANDIRKDIITMLVEAGSGHSAGPLGMADVFTALYFHILNVDPQKPKWVKRDRVVLSNGHIAPVLYATLAERGFFPRSELLTLRKLGSRLQGHPNNHFPIGIETCSGPLAQGWSQALGFALADRIDAKDRQTYLLSSDGELDEGQAWEAILFAGKMKLHNLTALIDRNNIQIDGFTEDVMPLEPLADKFRAANWHVLEIDGHNMQGIIDAYAAARAVFEKPTVIIAHTIPGKGVDFMEWKPEWHGKAPDEEQAKVALHELRTLGGRIRGEHQ